MEIPLRYRLPNPPPLFIGRTPEATQLRTLIHRAPVTILWGLGGLGKTSLLLHTLHHHFPDKIPHTLFIGLRPGDRPQVEIMRAIAAAHGLQKVDWTGLLTDPDALLATLIDRTEERAHWIVLDDLHHADPNETRDLLTTLARYARTTRWIFTTRTDPQIPHLTDQLLFLRGMPHADLYHLATQYPHHLDPLQIEHAITASAGSPWHLRQLLTGTDPKTALTDHILQGISPAATNLLQTLAILDLPLSPNTLQTLAPLPPPTDLETLHQRGLLERSAGGLRLHDLARTTLTTHLDLRAHTHHVAHALAQHDDPLAKLEALRLLLSLGRLEQAATLLDDACETLLAADLSPRLFQLLSPLEHPRFTRHRLRCAVDLGDPTALDALTLPKDPTLQDHFLWALSLLVRGRIADTAPIAADVRRKALAAKPSLPTAVMAFQAGIIESDCLGEQGHATEALAVLDTLEPMAPTATAFWQARRARWLTHIGRIPEALIALEQIISLPLDPRSPALRELRDDLITDYAILGRIRRLEQSLSALSLHAPTGTAHLFGFRRGLLAESLLDMHAGRLDKASRVLAAISPLMRQTSYLRSFLHALSAEQRLCAGELEDLEDLIAAHRDEADRSGHALNASWSVVHALRLAVIRGQSTLPPYKPLPRSTPFWQAIIALHTRQHALHHGLSLTPLPPFVTDIIHGRTVVSILAAEEQLIAGRPAAARAHAAAAHAAAREHGYAPGELEALGALCDALLCAGDAKDLGRAATELEERARDTGSKRFAGEARFYKALAGRAPHPAELEEISLLLDTAPVAARRAKAMLGEPAPLDRVDRAVLDVLSRKQGPASIRRVAEAPVGPPSVEGGRAGWGLDMAQMTVWLPGGRSVDLSSKRLFVRILATIAERGGRATKEELVLGAWEQRDYHPMRDDKRLQVAIRKLRLLIEDDPSKATRLITTDEGYAFGPDEPFRLRTPAEPCPPTRR